MNSYLQDKFLLLHLVTACVNRFLLVSVVVRSGREQRGVFISSSVASSRVRKKIKKSWEWWVLTGEGKGSAEDAAVEQKVVPGSPWGMVLAPASPMWCHPWDTEPSPCHGCTHQRQQFLLKAHFFKAPASWGCQEVRGGDTPRPGGEVLSLLLVSTDGLLISGGNAAGYLLDDTLQISKTCMENHLWPALITH